MTPELLAFWNEGGETAARQNAARTAELEAYWHENIAPGERLDVEKATALLLRKVTTYENALRRIADKPHEQEALIKHRKESGQQGVFADEQIYGAYLEMAHIAWAALGWMPRRRPGLKTS